MLFAKLIDRVVKVGSLTVIDAAGRRRQFGGEQPGPAVTMRLHDRTLHHRLFLNPNLALGEAYMDGTLTIEDAEICDLMDLFGRNLGWDIPDHWTQRLLLAGRRLGRRITQYNPVHRARRNVAHHYDLSGALYELFLDSDRQYSCAYFMGPGDDLEAAQTQKKRHIAAKLLLGSGQRVLDIGSGWGGLALHLARRHDVDVTGVTLSQEQHRVSNERASAESLQQRVRFNLHDYRQVEGRFDRIVSVGMFEHVGVGHYAEFFDTVRRLLSDDGVALLHTIGRADGPGVTNPWIDKYIFPGGYSPALSEILPVIERTGLYVTDVEVLRLHYAETLKAWRERFAHNRERVRQLYDERFCRMWELYLAGSEMAFRHGGHVVFQIQMARSQDAVPLTRDYITEYERNENKARPARSTRAA